MGFFSKEKKVHCSKCNTVVPQKTAHQNGKQYLCEECHLRTFLGKNQEEEQKRQEDACRAMGQSLRETLTKCNLEFMANDKDTQWHYILPFNKENIKYFIFLEPTAGQPSAFTTIIRVFVTLPVQKRAALLRIINEWNRKHRFFTVFLEDDNSLVLRQDIFCDAEAAGRHMLLLLMITEKMMPQIFQQLTKCVWGTAEEANEN